LVKIVLNLILYYIMNVSTITLLFKVIPGYMFRLDFVILRPILCYQILRTLWGPIVFTFVGYI